MPTCKVVIKTVRSKRKLKWIGNFCSILQYEISSKSVYLFWSFFIRTERQTDGGILIGNQQGCKLA
jgi:hypothetical protein